MCDEDHVSKGLRLRPSGGLEYCEFTYLLNVSAEVGANGNDSLIMARAFSCEERMEERGWSS